MIDLLVDDLTVTSILLINCRITYNGIIPEVGYFSMGRHPQEVDLISKTNKIICKIELPSFITRHPLSHDWAFHSNTTEFRITKVYD